MLSPESNHPIKNLTPPGFVDLEQIADEFIFRIRQGDQPSVSEYQERFPDLSDEIEEFFPAIAALEGGKYTEPVPGKVSLGASVPEQLGDFQIVREIGRGGMGVVYEAIQESLNRHVALKLLPRHLLLDEKQLKRFRREAELTASLHHTNIVPVYGVGQNSGFHYYVMQLIEGIGLDELTQKLVETAAETNLNTSVTSSKPRSSLNDDTVIWPSGDVSASETFLSTKTKSLDPEFEQFVNSPRKIAALGIQAANALQYAHDRGILHRDIKPGNLLLDRDGLLCITDFGLARVAEQSDMSKSTNIAGTLGYMAPEMFRGETCRQSDIYGLGITLYELLTKRFAIERTSRHEMIEKITQGSITSLRRIDPDIPRDLETIVLKAIAPDTKHRYQKASDLAADLKRFLENRPIHARRVTPFEQLWRWSCRNPAIASLSGVAAGLVLLLGVTMAVGFERERQERKKAEASAQLATAALDRVFDRFVPSRAQASETTGSVPDYSEPILSRESADLLAGMVQFYEQLAESTGSQQEFRLKAAGAQHKVGDIHRRLGDFEAALIAYQKSLELYQLEFNETQTLIMATLYNEIGRTYRSLGELSQSRSAHATAQQLLKAAIKKKQDQADLQFELARTYFLDGRESRPEQFQGGPPDSPGVKQASLQAADLVKLQQAIDILEKLIDETQDLPEYSYLLARCLQEQIPDRIVKSDSDQLKQDRILEILENLTRDYPQVADYRQAIVKAYERVNIRDARSDDITDDTVANLKKAIQHASRLVSDYPTIPEYKISLIHAHNKLAHVMEMLSMQDGQDNNDSRLRHETAEWSLRTALRLQKELVEQFPELPEHKLWLAKFEIALARGISKKGNETEAIELLTDAVNILEPDWESHQESPHYLADLLDATEELARVYYRAGSEVESLLMWDQHDQYDQEFKERFPGKQREEFSTMRPPPKHRQGPPHERQPPPQRRPGPPERRAPRF